MIRNPKLIIEVAAALIEEKGKYLVTQRKPQDHLGLFWEFPGGKREEGESLEDGLCRELREELGLEIAVGDIASRVEHEYEDRKVILYFYCCHILGGEPRALDCHDFKWLAAGWMREEDFPPADAKIIRMLRKDAGYKMQDL